jgi:hypothetical protein
MKECTKLRTLHIFVQPFMQSHTIHSSIIVHLGPSPSPHRLGAQREKKHPWGAEQRIELGPAFTN